jgi:catalase-peroxidase
VSQEMKCPVPHGQPSSGTTATETASPKHGAVTHNSRLIIDNEHWWPDRLDLAILGQNNELVDPMGAGCCTRPRRSEERPVRSHD